MPPFLLRLAALTLAVFATAPAAASAGATCATAVPAAAALTDVPDDAEPRAPELGAIRARVNADCTITVTIAVENRRVLRPDDVVLTYFDTDGSPTTGARNFGGGDLAAGLLADDAGPGHASLLGRWDPREETFDFGRAKELDVAGAGFGFTVGLDDLVVRSGGVLGISVAALSQPDGDVAMDFAPDGEGELLFLPVAYTAAAAAPALSSDRASVTGQADSVRRRDRRDGRAQLCRVPRVRGRTVAGAQRMIRAAGCRTGRSRWRRGTTVRSGRVVAPLPGTGTRIAASRPVTLIVAR